MSDERKKAIHKIISVIIDELEDCNKGRLTARYIIGVLNDSAQYVENIALMRAFNTQESKDES
ncbi:MAG: hypothetical protein FWC08_13365 [Defluviitaleaceae bacterium]|nr:hypothetical protein [Defluviitaleaceae bacterium]